MLRRRGFWLTFAVTGLFLWLFLRDTHFGEVGRELANASYIYLVPAVAVYFVGVWFRALRWRLLLQPLGSTSTNSLFPVKVIGFMINDIIPGRVGMVAMAYLGGEKAKVSTVASAATIVMEAILDGLALLFILAVVAAFVPWDNWAKILVLVTAIFSVLALLLMAFLAFGESLSRRLFRPFKSWLPERWGKQLSTWLARFVEGLGILRSPSRLVPVFIVSLLAWLSETGTYYFVSRAFSLGLSYHSLLVVAALASMAWALVFVSPGGLGAFDYVGKKALGIFAVSEGLATTYITVLHAVLLLPVILLGFIFLWWEHFSLGQVTRSTAAAGATTQSAEKEKERQ